MKRDVSNMSMSPAKRSGRPRVTSERTDNRIAKLIKQVPNITSAQIKLSFPAILDDVDSSAIRAGLTKNSN